MKKLFKIGIFMLILIGCRINAELCTTGGAIHECGSHLVSDFKKTLHIFEKGGGTNAELQKKVCSLGIARLNELREIILAKFPALQAKKLKAEKDLSIIVQNLSKTVLKSAEYKSLASKKEQVLADLSAVEDEVEAQLHSNPDLSPEFNKIREILKHWCD